MQIGEIYIDKKNPELEVEITGFLKSGKEFEYYKKEYLESKLLNKNFKQHDYFVKFRQIKNPMYKYLFSRNLFLETYYKKQG